MKQSLQTSHGLMDIEPLAPPPESNTPAVISFLLLVIFLVTLTTFAVRRFNGYRSQARRRLRRLQNRVEQQDTGDTGAHDINIQKDTAYRLARILSHGLGLNGITSSTPLPAELDQHHDRWQLFINNLSLSRFAKSASKTSSSNNSNIKEMLDDAFFWLKNWP
ncbi:MAG: hypothetical protein ACN4GR_13295 [Arenicellales bacterium]